MELKIFKPALYTIIMVLSIHGYASGQGLSPDKEKDLEAKLERLELKLQNMQVKLDSMKVNEKSLDKVRINGLTIAQKDLQKTIKSLQKGNFTVVGSMPGMPPMPPVAMLEDISGNLNESFKGLSRTMNTNFNYNFNFDSSDKKLEAKIKNGEAKEKTKNYSKSYSVSPGDKLQIDNRFGRVTVNTWNKNEFKVDVEIKAIANQDDEAQKLLDGVSINDNKDGSVISFTTNIENKGNNVWGTWNNGGKSYVHKIEVNYTIYMPTKNALDITNRYGSIVLPDFDGKVMINSSYGSFTAKTLTNPVNDITTQYGNATIESLNGSELKVSYGNLNLGSSDNLNAEISYGTAKIDKIKSSGTITTRYSGSLNIGDLDKNFKNLSINAAYSSVLLGLNSDPGFNFDVSVRYGSFNYGDHGVNITTKTPGDDDRGWNPTKTYKGHLGKASTDKLVTIKSTYGSVKFD